MQSKSSSRYIVALPTVFVMCLSLCFISYPQLYQHLHLHSTTGPYQISITKQTSKSPVVPEGGPIAKRPESNFQETTGNSTPQAIVILTMRRSGSSIFGSIFNQENNKAFYLYEPLFPFNEKCQKFERIEALKHLFKCEFEEIQPLYKKAFNRTERSDLYARCKNNHICFAGVSKKIRAFIPKKVCDFSEGDKRCKQNGSIHLEALRKNCTQNKVVVMKLVYLCKLEWLFPLLEDPAFNIKVIHLVRDPRATTKSRSASTLLRSSSIKKYSKEICEQLTRNVNFVDRILNHTTSRDRYLRIRYEDFAWDPIKTAQKVYAFAGLEITKQVEKWLRNATSPVNHKNWSKLKPHSWRRNASYVISAWRTELTFDKVFMIQKSCAPVMEKLGYEVYQSENSLRDLRRLHFVPD